MAKTVAARGPPSTETMGARGPKSPNRPAQKCQACLILEPTSPNMMTESRRRHGRRRHLLRRQDPHTQGPWQLPHLAAPGEAPAHRTYVLDRLGHTTAGSPHEPDFPCQS
jgi:hypothetical protein